MKVTKITISDGYDFFEGYIYASRGFIYGFHLKEGFSKTLTVYSTYNIE